MSNFLNKNNNDDENLFQGGLYLNNKKTMINMGRVNLPLLEQTSLPPSESIIETLEGLDPTHGSKQVNITNVSTLEDEFNKTLSQYTKNYQMLMDELITNNKQQELLKYAGKNIKYGNNYYFINNFGYAHEYNDVAWKDRSNSCSEATLDISANEFNKLLKGPNMGVGQACGVAGYNVHNNSNDEHSWVDIKGVRHVYPDKVWEHRSSSCQNTPKSLHNEQYANIPTLKPGQVPGDDIGPTLSEKSLCNTLNVDPSILQNLANLNDRLLTLGKELLVDTNKLVVEDTNVKAQLDAFNANMKKQLNKLQNDKKQFTTYNTNLAGAKESSQFYLSSHYLQYVLWLLTAILLIVFSFYNYSSNRQSTISLIILAIVGLILLYKFCNYIYYKLF